MELSTGLRGGRRVQGIAEVVRGCDLLDSTPRQILLQRLLGLPTPAYLHLPLATDVHGRKLSKSSDAPAIGVSDPRAALASALRFLGQPVPDARDVESMLRAAARNFDLSPLLGIARRPAAPFEGTSRRPNRQGLPI